MVIFNENKFTDTAIGIYKFIVSEQSFDDYSDYLANLRDLFQVAQVASMRFTYSLSKYFLF